MRVVEWSPFFVSWEGNTDDTKLVEALEKIKSKLETRRKPYVTLWQEVAEMLFPNWAFFNEYNDFMRGKKTGTKIYNCEAAMAAKYWADGIMGYLCNKSIDWFRMQMQRIPFPETPDVRMWLDDVTHIFYEVLNDSRFYASMHAGLLNGCTIATTTMYMGEDIDNDRIQFSLRHPMEIMIAENANGDVDTLYRQVKQSLRIIVQQFGKEALSRDSQLVYDEDPWREIEFVHAVYPGKEEFPNVTGQVTNKEFASVYYEKKTKHILRKKGFDDFPYFTWRTDKNPFEEYGRGPGIAALSEILGLNMASKTLALAAQKSVDPPMQTHEKMRGKVRTTPGAMNYFEGTERLEEVYKNIRYPFGMDWIDRKAESIRKWYKTDFFSMLANATKQMTAREVAELQEEKGVLLGAEMGRIEDEVFNPMFDRLFSMLYASGKIPAAPIELQGQNIKIDYVSPLALAQKRMGQMSGYRRSMDEVGYLMQYNPDVLDVINFDKATKHVLDANGMPPEVIRSFEEIQQIRRDRAQVQAQQQQAAAEIELAKSQDLGKKPEKGSVAQMLMEAQK